ncbi:MAG: osmoprotectant transporter permease [Bacteroidetes bacterium]|nr:MAG: osmoprotectant transporter permease [Bacteroidota bacterium]
MIAFWTLWGIDAVASLVVVVFFFIGIADGSVSASNAGLWFAILAALAVILLGSMWLKGQGYLGWAKALLSVLAVPALLYALFLLLVVVSKPRWN